jgi:Zinc carboxypeptidase
VKAVVIGKTVQGQDIVALKVTRDATNTRDGKHPAVLYSSAQHAREWITPK